MMKNKLKDLFFSLEKKGSQIKLPLDNCPLRLYCAISESNNYMLSILSTIPAPNITSTKVLKVEQLKENDEAFWINFELIEKDEFNVFITLCDDLINTIDIEDTEKNALMKLVNRFYYWQILFKNPKVMSEEKIKGLFGELLFLLKYMIPEYGIDKAIASWGGPSLLNKDFSICEKWYEVKTISINNNSVKISSAAQLSAKNDGVLVVVRLEKMSEEYNDGLSSLEDLFNEILTRITLNHTREMFLKKVYDYGFDFSNHLQNIKFRIEDMKLYTVNDKFPRIVDKDIKFKEIEKITYEIPLKSIEKFTIGE